MKKNTSSLLLVTVSLFTLFAFSLPKEIKQDFLTIFYPEAHNGVAEAMPLAIDLPTVEVPSPGLVSATAQVALDTIVPPPFNERLDNFIGGGSGNVIDLSDPAVVDKKIEYDPATGMYIITEKIGDNDYRAPTYMTFEEYSKWKANQQEKSYFDKLAGVNSGSNGKGIGLGVTDPIAKLDLKNSSIDRLFGGTTVDIRPQGNINLTFGVDYQKVQNPLIPLRAQNNGGPRFDFDMDINMSATGKIGEKLNLNFNYNTQATFDFDNQMKLNYDTKNFSEDEILQNIQAGDVSFPLKTTLIQGSQRLFGVKADMKFGHLRLSALASQQRSKQQNISVQGGSTLQTFELPIDNYDENRHFFLSHYNRNTFERSLSCLPNVQNLFTVTRMEVWITNDINRTENTRDIVAIADLAEPRPLLNQHELMGGQTDIYDSILPYNGVNGIYRDILGKISEDSAFRYSNRIVNGLSGPEFGMKQIKDFEKVRGRLLSQSEYSFHDQLGFVSLNLNVQPDIRGNTLSTSACASSLRVSMSVPVAVRRNLTCPK